MADSGPVITICEKKEKGKDEDDFEIYIEAFRKITEFSDKLIKVIAGNIIVKIECLNGRIETMDSELIRISGRLDSISFVRLMGDNNEPKING